MAEKSARKPKKDRSAEWLEGALKRFSDEDLSSELKRRHMAQPHAPFVMPDRKPQTRVEFLRERVRDLQETLDTARSDRVPGGIALAIKQQRIRSLGDLLRKNRNFLELAEADEKKAAEALERS